MSIKKKKNISKKQAPEIASKYAIDIVRTIREAVLILDDELRVVTASNSFYDTFKVNPGNTEGQFLYELGNGQWNLPELRHLLGKILPEKTSIESFRVTHDFPSIGKQVMLLNARQLLDKKGKRPYILLVIANITEQEKARKKLKAAQKKLYNAEKFAALGRLSGMIGHDLRNILGTMKTCLYVLEQVNVNEDEKKNYRKYLDLLNKEVNDADRMTANILNYSREKDLRLEELNIRSIIKETITRISVPVSVKIVIRGKKGMPKVKGDRVQLKQVFSNLIINALQAIPGPGRIDIELSYTKDKVNITFKDTGEGISKEDMTKIFEPLYSTKQHGTGLGLFSCKSIIKKHKGSIDVKSIPGEGTTVQIKLPR